MRLLFVVHRYAPYPGGSEYYTANMAEEMLKRGHDVYVLAPTNQGDYNGVKLLDDFYSLGEKWDLIIVHGGDVPAQNIVHINADRIQSPVLYLIVKPSDSKLCIHGLNHHRFLGYSTSMDVEHLRKHSVLEKGRRVRHGIVPDLHMRFTQKEKTIFVSAGGFWPHKAMQPLAAAFTKAKIPNAELHLYGYGEEHLMPKETNNVKCFFGKEKTDVLLAVSGADAYIMNSYEEGFGLVLLESMMNKTPWYARDIAGAKDMCYYGTTYNDESELIDTSSFCFKREFIQKTCHFWHAGWGGDRQYFYSVKAHAKYDTNHKHTLCYRLDGNPKSVTQQFFDTGNKINDQYYEGKFPWLKT